MSLLILFSLFNFEFLFSGYLSLLVLRPRLRMNFVKKKHIFFFSRHMGTIFSCTPMLMLFYTQVVWNWAQNLKTKRQSCDYRFSWVISSPLPFTVKAKMNKHPHRLLMNVLICLCCCNKILQDRNSFSYNSEAWEKSKYRHIRFLVEVFLVVVQMATFLLCSHVAFSWGCKWRES